MKRIDRLVAVLSIFVVKFFIICGFLIFVKADETIIFMFSIFALLILVIYLFGELAAIDIKQILEAKEQQRYKREKQIQEIKQEQQGWAGFRRIFGGEDYE